MSGMDASYWENPDDDSPVIRHAPDIDQYHYPHETQLGQMRPGRVRKFPTIPRAKNDGSSYGFDCLTPGVVHVDPGAPDGGTVVDYSRLDKRAVDDAVAHSRWAHQAFYKLGEITAVQPAPRTNGATVITGAQEAFPVNPPNGAPPQLAPQLQAQPAQPQHAQQPPQPQYAQQPYPFYGYPPPQPPPQFVPMQQDPQIQAMLAALTGSVEAINRRLDMIERPAAPPALSTIPVGVPPRGMVSVTDPEFAPQEIPRRAPRLHDPAPSVAQSQTLREYRESNEEPADALIVGFETLGIPFINGPVAQRPKIQVFFDYGPMGRQSARFHEIKIEKHSIMLVYDTRYEEGTQYLPPEGDQTFTLTVAGTKKEYRVLSTGLVHNLGVLDFVILVIAGDTPAVE